MSYYRIELIAKDLENLSKEAKEYAEKFSQEFADLEEERDALADLVQTIRYYCYCSKPMNVSILKLIEEAVKQQFKYEDPIWTRDYPVCDETGAEVDAPIAGLELYGKRDEQQ